MLRWLSGIALASLAASAALGSALSIQQILEGPSSALDDLRGPGPLMSYVAFASLLTFVPVAAVGSLIDSTLVRLRRQELWAYALAGLIAGGLIGWFLATSTPQSHDDDAGGSIVAKSWRLALFGLTASSTFWWVVRRNS